MIAITVFASIICVYYFFYEIFYLEFKFTDLKTPDFFIYHFFFEKLLYRKQIMVFLLIFKWIILLGLGITINMAFDKSLAERSFIKEILN